MSSRSFIDKQYSVAKKLVHLFADITVSEGGTPVPTLNRWNYGTFGSGPTVNTYTAAPTTPVPPSNSGNYASQFQIGSEGVMMVTRTATGLYTLRLQDNYMRLMGLGFFIAAAAGSSAVGKCNENTTISNLGAAGGSLIGLAFLDFAGAAVDPIGHMRLHLILADSTAP